MFQKAWSIYTESFADFERRSLFEHLKVMRQPRYRFSAILRGQEVVGVLGMWTLPGFALSSMWRLVPRSGRQVSVSRRYARCSAM